ncbi:MAG: AlpA family phage regulatory protein [Halorhodospira halophila]|uniref:helix-turn-helix transcriptional regulator n=1 Tax=Halorhodospira halophila TaxID=1053 RepID=UPI00350E5883|nr:AlpA family phage regulatory protein [Halorhodospira halophila]
MSALKTPPAQQERVSGSSPRSLADQLPCLARDVDVAKALGVHRATVHRWAQKGRLPRPVRLGTNYSRWRASDIVAWAREVGLESAEE